MRRIFFSGVPTFYLGYTSSVNTIYPGVTTGGILKLNSSYMAEADVVLGNTFTNTGFGLDVDLIDNVYVAMMT